MMVTPGTQKRAYRSPSIVVESYTLNGTVLSCSAFQINLVDEVCVSMDPNVPKGMRDLAGIGYFIDADNCMMGTPPHDPGDGVCIHTAIDLAFTS